MTQRISAWIAIVITSLFAAGCQSNGSKPTATITAIGHRATLFDWAITKSALPDVHNLFFGQTGTSQFTIDETKSVGSETFSVDGEVCVTNDGNQATQWLNIAVMLAGDRSSATTSIPRATNPKASRPVPQPRSRSRWPRERKRSQRSRCWRRVCSTTRWDSGMTASLA